MLVSESGSVTEVRPEQLWNANGSTTVNVSGILMEVSPVQSLHALWPMLVMVSGSVREVRLVQPWNVLGAILATSEGTTMFLILTLRAHISTTVSPSIFRTGSLEGIPPIFFYALR